MTPAERLLTRYCLYVLWFTVCYAIGFGGGVAILYWAVVSR